MYFSFEVSPVTLVLLTSLAIITVTTYVIHLTGSKAKEMLPPIVLLKESDILDNPRREYEKVLAEFGHVVGVSRKGRLEYIVDESLSGEVLTAREDFSFQEGTAKILNLHRFFQLCPFFFESLDDLVRVCITNRIDEVIQLVAPVFMRHSKNLVHSDIDDVPLDIFDHAHKSITEAMTLLIFGQELVSEQSLSVIESVAAEIAVLTGIYQNTSFFARSFPGLWSFITWFRVIFTSIMKFFVVIGPHIWTTLQAYNSNPGSRATDIPQMKDMSILEYLSRKEATLSGGRIGILAYLRITSLLLGIIFASVHQTASVVVWVTYEIAKRPEVTQALRDEFQDYVAFDYSTGLHIITYDALHNARLLDSFIREVLRTKGDTLSTVRMTTRDVSIGGYVIPKGCLVIPLATLSHMSQKSYGFDADVLKPDRWLNTDKYAVTLNPSYFPFGLGRWACPGRTLAVSEIKLIVWSIIHIATPRLTRNSYRVVDPVNITSVPPQGDLRLNFRT